jgi:hypothetical protein
MARLNGSTYPCTQTKKRARQAQKLGDNCRKDEDDDDDDTSAEKIKEKEEAGLAAQEKRKSL